MPCQCEGSAFPAMGDLWDLFPPVAIARKAANALDAKANSERNAIVGGMGANIQSAAIAAAQHAGPYLLGAAAILAAGALGFAWITTQKKTRRGT